MNMLLVIEVVCVLFCCSVLISCRLDVWNIWCMMVRFFGEVMCRLLIVFLMILVVDSLVFSCGLVLCSMIGVSLIFCRNDSEEVNVFRLLCSMVLLILIMVKCLVFSCEKCLRYWLIFFVLVMFESRCMMVWWVWWWGWREEGILVLL